MMTIKRWEKKQTSKKNSAVAAVFFFLNLIKLINLFHSCNKITQEQR